VTDIPIPFNPYDFANPVSDMKVFADRTREREEILYYLEHTKKSPHPISIALMGARAAGKTSLLNFTEQEAKDRGFLAVRINLDEENVANPFSFFFKIFDSVFTEALTNGCFEGFGGQTYETYLQITTTFKTDVDKIWMPFVFPLIYAQVCRGQTALVAQFPDNVFVQDLARMRTEVARPIVLIFDECDLLSKARAILQKLRNTFMNLQGYMIVFAGTPLLFPVMDDVFSPIVRQFKKIPVHEFGDKKDTEECIRKPLELVKDSLSDEAQSISRECIQEVHDLAAGRPYEVQLLCHAMFKRIQSGRAKRMALDFGVLEDVQQELAKEQDISSRPVLAAIRSLSDKQLRNLVPFCRIDREITMDQIWQLNCFARQRDPLTKEELVKSLSAFEANNYSGDE
jgi:AAA+ ATPase superfamily predicted ATPase